MACPGEGILTNLTKTLENKTIKEFKYFRDFENHDHDFVIENKNLIAKRKKVGKDIEDAKKNNENQIEAEVQNWMEQVDFVIQENTKINQEERPHGWRYPYWQYRQGKKLAKRTPTIRDLIQKCDFQRLTRPTELSGIKYHASRDFIDFESRKTKFKQLVEALQDGKHWLIGLHGMGGTGKTTLATQVGKQLEESKAFGKVIFAVVSNSPDINKIRGDIARPLSLNLEEKAEAEHSEQLWTRISNNESRLLIILDDMWEGLNLKDIGIPSGPEHKNCYVLITTRDFKVCNAMGCQQVVRLPTLTNEEALTLFLSHARSGENSSNNTLEDFAQDFVKECGGLPIAIVALASTLRNYHAGELNAVLTILQKSKPFVDFDKDMEKVYKCLELSYAHLPNEKVQKLFLLCSVFPEDYEFPIHLIVRLGMGSGIFEEVDEYFEARSQALMMKTKLIDSCLLHKVGEKECVKMHDLVREVAQWVAKDYIQVIMNSRTTLRPNMRFVFWIVDGFPDLFDGTKLEILLLWVKGNVLINGRDILFARTPELKILFLRCEHIRKLPTTPSLWKSLLPLKFIHTLILDGWHLGDISALKNMQSLVTLEFKNCLIFELPKNIVELRKLRWLGLRRCEIQRNNPFEVINRCSELEELYFIEICNVKGWKITDGKEIEEEIALDTSTPELQIFSIAYDGFERFANDDNGLLRCFNPRDIKHLIPDAMFKYLVRNVEVLEMGKIGHARWKNLSPDIIPLENGSKDNLIKLYLYEWDEIECLIDCSKDHCSNIAFFSKLVELHLYGVDLEKLYFGPMPSSFLQKLQVLNLKKCGKLQNIFFDENIKLYHLRVLILIGCPMFHPSIFQTTVAQNLKRLEELIVEDCEELTSLIAFEESLEREMIVALFPELKSLQIQRCGKLEMVLPLLLAGDLPKLKDLLIGDCVQLKCIFGEYRDACQVLQQEIILPSLTKVQLDGVPSFISIFQNCKKCVLMPSAQALKENSKEKHENSKSGAFSWAYGCCFLAQTKDTNISVSNVILEHHTISQGSSKGMETLHTPMCLMRQPFILQNIKELTLIRCSKLKSLFNVSIAATIMLEKLYINECEELKQLITHEAEDDDHLKCTSIFPKLQSLEIWSCHKLEFIFSYTLSGGLQNLKSISINYAEELKYVFGKYDDEECVSHEIENNESHIHLPALESLDLWQVRNMISVGIKKYQQKCPSLQFVKEAPQMQDVTSERAKEPEVQEIVDVETPLTPIVGVAFQNFLNFHNLKTITIKGNLKLKTLFTISAGRNLPQLSLLNITACLELVCVVDEEGSNDNHHMNNISIFPKLEKLYIRNCNKLEYIFPLSFYDSLQKLKSLSIDEAAELKGIFKNESDELQIYLSTTLEGLSLWGVPKIMNKILAKKYHLSFLSQQSLELGNLQEFNGRSFLDLMASLQGMQLAVKVPKDLMRIMKDVQKLTRLRVQDSKIEEVVNLEGVEIEGAVLTLSLKEMRLEDHCELRHIWKGPKYIMSLPNLRHLDIIACKRLRVIFSVSIVKSLPQLRSLKIKECDELVDIIEESDEVPLHQICFPKLRQLDIKRCNSLKCLFSISTCGMFPKLCRLEIEEASEMEQVFIHKQDDVQNMTIMKEQVFPDLSDITLTNLPRLVTICEGIDFQNVRTFSVNDCPKYKGTYHIEEEGDSKNQATTNASPDLAEGSKEAMTTSVSFSNEERVKEIEAKDPAPTLLEKQPQLTSASLHNYEETEKEGGRAVSDPASKLPAPSSASSKTLETRSEVAGTAYESSLTITASCSNSKIMEETSIQIQAKDSNRAYGKQTSETWEAKSQLRVTSLPELKDEDTTSESVMQLQQETKTTKASYKTNVPFHDNSIDAILNERATEEGPTLLEDVVAAIMVADLKPRSSRNVTCSIVSPVQDHLAKRSKTEKEGVRVHASQLMATTSTNSEIIPNIEEDPTIMKAKTDTLFIDPQEEGSQSTIMSVERIQKEIPTMEAKTDTSSSYSQSGPSTMIYEESKEEVGFGKTLLALPATSTLSNKERVKEMEAKDHAPTLLEKQAQLRSTSLHNFEETEKEDGRVVPEPASKLPPAPPLSSSQILETSKDVAAGTTSKSSSSKDTEEEAVRVYNTSQKSMAPNSTNSPQITKNIKDPMEQGLEQKGVAGIASKSSVTTTTSKVSSMKETHEEEGFKEDEATEEPTLPVQLFDSESRKQPKVSPTITQIAQRSKDTKEEQDLEVNYAEDDVGGSFGSSNSDSRNQSTGSIHNLISRKDFAPSVKGTRDQSNVQEEDEIEKPIKAVLPQVIPSVHYQSQTAEAGTSSPKLGIYEIFKLVELKHGETALLVQALEQYPQLLLPRKHRTNRIIALSYRVLVDILVMLATKTPNAITQSEKSTLEANLSEAIFLGFDKDWVESVQAKVFEVDMSDVSKAKQEIQVMEVKLEEIDSQLLGLSEDRRKLIENMNMFRDIVSAKDKPFGI